MRRIGWGAVSVWLPLAGCGGGEMVGSVPSEPEPPPVVRVRLANVADVAEGRFDGWPVAVGPDTIRIEPGQAAATLDGARTGMPLAVLVPPETIPRRHYDPEPGGYRSTKPHDSGYGSIMDTVTVGPLERGRTVMADLRYRVDFVLSFSLTSGGPVPGSIHWRRTEGIPGWPVRVETPAGDVLHEGRTDWNGEMFLPLRAHPEVFAAELIVFRYAVPPGFRNCPHAGGSPFPIREEAEPFRRLGPASGVTYAIGIGDTCIPDGWASPDAAPPSDGSPGARPRRTRAGKE